MRRSSEGPFGINDPIVAEKQSQKTLEGFVLSERFEGTGKRFYWPPSGDKVQPVFILNTGEHLNGVQTVFAPEAGILALQDTIPSAVLRFYIPVIKSRKPGSSSPGPSDCAVIQNVNRAAFSLKSYLIQIGGFLLRKNPSRF